MRDGTAAPSRGGAAAWGVRACAALVVLAFAPEWTVAPMAARGPEMRILAVAVALAALVLLTLAVLSLGAPRPDAAAGPEPERGGADPPDGIAVRPVLGAWAGANWIEHVELTLGLALVASVLGGAATALPVIVEGAAPWIAVLVIAVVAALRFLPVSLPVRATGVLTGIAHLLLGVLVITGGLNFVFARAVPIAPAPVMALEAWRALPMTVVLQSFGIAAAIVAGVAVFARMGPRRGMGRLALSLGVLFLLMVAMHVAYGTTVGDRTPAVFPAVLGIFGGLRPISVAVVAALAWILFTAMLAFLRRGDGARGNRAVVALAGAAAVLAVVFQASVGTLAGLWVLAALAWIVPTHAALLMRGIRRGRGAAERTPAWRMVMHGLATVGTAAAALGALLFLTGCIRPPPDKRMDEVRLPPGFTIEVYVDDIEEPRQMALGDDGTLYVGTKILNKVYAVPDRDGDGRGDEVIVLAEDLEHSNGVAIRGDTLYVAETHQIIRYPGISSRLDSPPEPEFVVEVPWRDYHKEAYIRFGPDGALYATIGSPCDICLGDHPLLATISRVDVSPTSESGGRTFEIVAEGVRNSMGFDWHPETGEVWFADNGRDWLGDHVPPDEVNRLREEGLHFGFPHCHGRDVRDPEFGEGVDCSRFEAPVLELEPHVAALGAKFYDGDAFPEEYRSALFIAEHGSYNRSVRVGYRVAMVTGLAGGTPEVTTFADGFLAEDGSVWARPVDFLMMPDGSMLVSDDLGDTIYRIRYDPAAR